MESGTVISGAELHRRLLQMARPGERIYALVDSARETGLAQAAWFDFDLEHWSLFDSHTAPQMARVAPYLVALSVEPRYPHAGSGYLDLWAEKLGRSAGLFLFTDANPRVLWDHLTQIFNVADEDGKTYYFRFYDPRVFRTFLPTCSAQQRAEFFGPIRAFGVETEAGDELQEWGRDETQ